MKKLLIGLGLIAAVFTANAQDGKSKPSILGIPQREGDHKTQKMEDLTLWIFFGADFAQFHGDNSVKNKPITVIHTGVGANLLNISKDIGLRGELVYSQQGNQSSYGEASYYSSTTKTKLNYLNLPIMARYRHSSGFFAEAGLQPGLLLSAKQKRTSSGMGGGGNTNTDIKKDVNSFDLGIPIGAGFIFKKKIAASARVTPGLLKIAKNKDAVKQTNFVLSARVSYLL